MYNNYGYNPYQNRYIGVPQQPMQQPMQQSMPPTQMSVPSTNMLNGKQIPDVDTSKVVEYQLDGSINYFPLTDGSAIVTKQLQMDGTTKTTIYKPIAEQKEEVKYITQEDMKKAIDGLDLGEIDDIKDELKEIKQDIKDLKKKKKED